jgi:hypothetical protein
VWLDWDFLMLVLLPGLLCLGSVSLRTISSALGSLQTTPAKWRDLLVRGSVEGLVFLGWSHLLTSGDCSECGINFPAQVLSDGVMSSLQSCSRKSPCLLPCQGQEEGALKKRLFRGSFHVTWGTVLASDGTAWEPWAGEAIFSSPHR